MAAGKFEKGSERARELGSRGGSRGGGHKFSSGTAASDAGRRGAYVKYLKFLGANLGRELSEGKRAREAREALDAQIDSTIESQVASGRSQRKSAVASVRAYERTERLARIVGLGGVTPEQIAEAKEILSPEEELAVAYGADPDLLALEREVLARRK